LEGGVYQQEISRLHRTLIAFILDQSTSMEDPLGASGKRKMDELALALNSLLNNTVLRATQSEGIKDCLDISVIGYRTDQSANPIIGSALGGNLAGRELVSIVEIEENAEVEEVTQLIDDPETGEVLEVPVQVPVWVKATADGGTPMCSALHHVDGIISEWVEKPENKDSFPPIVVHISDGESTDGDPIPYAESLCELGTTDGNVLLFNCHLSESEADAILFPVSGEVLPNDQARTLYEMSSTLPPVLIDGARTTGFDMKDNARGMAFNAKMVQLIQFLDIGTRIKPNPLR